MLERLQVLGCEDGLKTWMRVAGQEANDALKPKLYVDGYKPARPYISDPGIMVTSRVYMVWASSMKTFMQDVGNLAYDLLTPGPYKNRLVQNLPPPRTGSCTVATPSQQLASS